MGLWGILSIPSDILTFQCLGQGKSASDDVPEIKGMVTLAARKFNTSYFFRESFPN